MLSSLFCRQAEHSSGQQLAAVPTWLGAMPSAARQGLAAVLTWHGCMAWLHGMAAGLTWQAVQGCTTLQGLPHWRKLCRNAVLLLLEPCAALTGSIACSCSGKWLWRSPGCTDQSVLPRLPETAGQLPEQCTAWWHLTAGEACSAAVKSEACMVATCGWAVRRLSSSNALAGRPLFYINSSPGNSGTRDLLGPPQHRNVQMAFQP